MSLPIHVLIYFMYSACLGTSVVPHRTSQTPGGLAVSLLTTKAAYNTAINLGSLAIGQKLGEGVGPGTHQATTLLVKLKPLESMIFLPSHLHVQHLKITPSVNLASSWARIKHPLHIQKQGTNIFVRPYYYYITTILPPGQAALAFLCGEAGSNISSPG